MSCGWHKNHARASLRIKICSLFVRAMRRTGSPLRVCLLPSTCVRDERHWSQAEGLWYSHVYVYIQTYRHICIQLICMKYNYDGGRPPALEARHLELKHREVRLQSIPGMNECRVRVSESVTPILRFALVSETCPESRLCPSRIYRGPTAFSSSETPLQSDHPMACVERIGFLAV